VDESESETEATKTPSSGSQPSPSGFQAGWTVVRLISVKGENATISMKTDGVCKTLEVPHDKLQAKFDVEGKGLKKATKHPSIQEAGDEFHSYDFQVNEAAFLMSMMSHIGMWALHTMHESVVNVSMSRLSGKDADGEFMLPLILQLRAKKAIKKGGLILTPALGDIMEANAWEKIKPNQVLSTEMITHVNSSATYGAKYRKKEKGEDAKGPTTKQFIIASPLLACRVPTHRKKALNNVHPFWALLRCANAQASHNMELDYVNLRDAGFDVKAGQFPRMSKEYEMSFKLPVARNCEKIEAGEVLLLSFAAAWEFNNMALSQVK
jgi:hypothetical protein